MRHIFLIFLMWGLVTCTSIPNIQNQKPSIDKELNTRLIVEEIKPVKVISPKPASIKKTKSNRPIIKRIFKKKKEVFITIGDVEVEPVK